MFKVQAQDCRQGGLIIDAGTIEFRARHTVHNQTLPSVLHCLQLDLYCTHISEQFQQCIQQYLQEANGIRIQ